MAEGNDKGFPCAGPSFRIKARRVTLNYLSFIVSVNSVRDISRLAVYRLNLCVYPPQCSVELEVSGSVNICQAWQSRSGKCTSVVTALNGAVWVSDEEAMNFGFFTLSSPWKRRWHRSPHPIFQSRACWAGGTFRRATKSLSVEGN